MSNTEVNPALYESYECPAAEGRRLIQRLESRKADVGGIPINRLMPQRGRRLIGAWCFADHAGPSVFSSDSQGMRVAPHPHTSLQTFTWMLGGELVHHDSLGSEQIIRPGELNLMTAGHGIAHTEQSVRGSRELHAAQLWIALPYADRNTAPRFDHYAELPHWSEQDVDVTLLVGTLNGQEAPTLAFSPLVAADLVSRDVSAFAMALRDDFEYGVLVLQGELRIDRDTFAPNQLAYLGCGLNNITLMLNADSRVLLLGGQPLREDILIWWNFVGHSKAEIVEAQREWETRSTRFGNVVGFDGERLMPPPIPWRV